VRKINILLLILFLFIAQAGYSALSMDRIIKTAVLMEKQKQYDKAEKLYKFVLQKEPGSIEALKGLGRVNVGKKNYKFAIIYLELANKKAEAAKKDNKDGLILLGDVYKQKGIQEMKSNAAKAKTDLAKAKGYYDMAQATEKSAIIDKLMLYMGAPKAVVQAKTATPQTAAPKVSPKTSSPYDKMLTAARAMEDKGGYDNAEKIYKYVLKKDANNISALKDLGRLYSKKGNDKLAVLYLKLASDKAEKQDIDFSEGNSILGNIFLKQGMKTLKSDKAGALKALTTADMYFKKAKNTAKQKIVATLLKKAGAVKGTTKKQAAKKVAAGTAPKKVISISRISIMMKLIKIGSIYIEGGQYDKGIDKMKKALSIDKTNQYAYYLLGRAYMKKGDASEAYRIWQKGWQYGQNYAKLANVLAPYYYAQAETFSSYDFENALKFANDALTGYAAIHDAEGTSKTKMLIAKLNRKINELKVEELKAKARERARQMLLAKIKSEEKRKEMAKKFAKQKKTEELALRAKKPLSYRDYFKRGNKAYHRRKYGTAVSDYKKALAIKKDFAKAVYNLGCAYYKLKNYDTSILYLKSAYNMLGSDPAVLYNLSMAYKANADIVNSVYYAADYLKIFDK